jgi:uncharacterized protein
MDVVTLTDEEARVLGSLVEKSVTTPEYYPLSLNALKNACNQKSSRDPVVEYDESAVARALEGLRDKHLVWFVDSADSRVQKYRHRFTEAWDLSEAEAAVLDLLLLRGPQTPGELRGRSERLHAFSDVEEVESALLTLSGRDTPLVERLPRQPGRKEHRWAQTLCGGVEAAAELDPVTVREAPVFREIRSDRDRLAALEAEVASLRQELLDLREEVAQFRRQFE